LVAECISYFAEFTLSSSAFMNILLHPSKTCIEIGIRLLPYGVTISLVLLAHLFDVTTHLFNAWRLSFLHR